MRYHLKIILLLLLSSSLFAQYNLKSSHLQNPDKAIGFVDSCAQFWIDTYDPVYGGFYTNIDKTGNVIYNLTGQKIAEIVNQHQPAGTYKINFDGSGLASGLYIYQLQAGDMRETSKMIIMK